jgi:hypothetical protein
MAKNGENSVNFLPAEVKGQKMISFLLYFFDNLDNICGSHNLKKIGKVIFKYFIIWKENDHANAIADVNPVAPNVFFSVDLRIMHVVSLWPGYFYIMYDRDGARIKYKLMGVMVSF